MCFSRYLLLCRYGDQWFIIPLLDSELGPETKHRMARTMGHSVHIHKLNNKHSERASVMYMRAPTSIPNDEAALLLSCFHALRAICLLSSIKVLKMRSIFLVSVPSTPWYTVSYLARWARPPVWLISIVANRLCPEGCLPVILFLVGTAACDEPRGESGIHTSPPRDRTGV